jgi:quinoprotein glucose dehydrogenase
MIHYRILLVCLLAAATCNSVNAQTGTQYGEWRFNGGDGGSTKYAPYTQINTQNVADLEVAWRWKAVTSGENPDYNYEATPIMIGGVLYVSTGASEVAAVDAGTGKTIWVFTPGNVNGRRPGSSGRGVAYWESGSDQRIFHNSIDGRLFAIDANTGKLCTEFGRNGVVHLKNQLSDRPVPRVGSSSPAIVVGDVVVVQVVASIGASTKEAIPGHIRGYDARTGERLWIFHTVPQAGEFGVETWQNESWKYTGNAGVWTLLSADQELGYVYLPLETATNDWYGGHRVGDNLFAESLVCLNAKTGERVWHYQTIHHGLWDYDLPAAPVLCNITVNGRNIKAVAQVTKQGFCFVFDRVTGKPVWPIHETPVPQSKVSGEFSSPTQPIPSKPAPFEPQGISEDNLFDLTPELHKEAKAIAAQYEMGTLFTPPSLLGANGKQGTLALPGYGGGANWPGASLDVEEGILYIPSVTVPIVMAVDRPPDTGRSNMDYVRVGPIYPAGPDGLPLVKPPWGRITAIDLNTGEHLWMVPNGGAPKAVRDHPALKEIDTSSMGQNGRAGALVTKTLLFVGEGGGLRGGGKGGGGPMLRAYDKKTGIVIAEHKLPGGTTGVPMSYMHEGKQYICVAIGAEDLEAELVALALP